MTRIGQIIGGRYRLTHVIGEGAMGEVYRARALKAFATDAGPAHDVAIKLLRPERLRDAEAVERFLAEVQAMRAVSHPSIARVLDSGETDAPGSAGSRQPFVVMELLGGESLRTLLRHHGRVDRGTALAVILPVLEALEAAHRQGVIHRDVKPENIQIRLAPTTKDGAGARATGAPMRGRAQVMVLDFGIAKVVDAAIAIGHHTTVGMVVGTPGYFAPEQAVGETTVDGRVDVFAVGAVLFEMLTGQRAFDGTSPVAIASRVVSEEVPTLAALHVDGPPELQLLLDRALAKKAADRFPTAQAFADAAAELAPGELGRRILLDSWVASTGAAGKAVRPRKDRDGATGESDTETDLDDGAIDTADDSEAADTDASGAVVAAAVTSTSPLPSPPERVRVMPPRPRAQAVCEPTMKSEADPLIAAVSARASALKPAVHMAESPASAGPVPVPSSTHQRAEDVSHDGEDEENDDW